MACCANSVLACTTRESARLWHTARLFNLRHSSDAPNLQVENEETIEALSARAKALLEFSPTALFICGSNIHASVRTRAMPVRPGPVPVPSLGAVFLGAILRHGLPAWLFVVSFALLLIDSRLRSGPKEGTPRVFDFLSQHDAPFFPAGKMVRKSVFHPMIDARRKTRRMQFCAQLENLHPALAPATMTRFV